MLKALYIMNPADWDLIYPPDVHSDICRQVQILAPVLSPEQALKRPDLLQQMDVLLSGWGGPYFDEFFLTMSPNLQAIFYGGGSVRHLLSQAFAEREIAITTANSINAIPVTEFTTAHITLGLKRAFQHARETKSKRAFLSPRLPVAGSYQSTVGLISLSTIGRLVLDRLKSSAVRVIAYDPTVTSEAVALNVEMVTLEELFALSDVVSLHAPVLPETEGMITGALLASMKKGATFINTARGVIVREDEMIKVLRVRPDLTAILDVTEPEPPSSTSGLFDLPNAVVTPHIAGSMDRECARLGRWMVDELQRFLSGQQLISRPHTDFQDYPELKTNKANQGLGSIPNFSEI